MKQPKSVVGKKRNKAQRETQRNLERGYSDHIDRKQGGWKMDGIFKKVQQIHPGTAVSLQNLCKVPRKKDENPFSTKFLTQYRLQRETQTNL
jgi:lysozyme family protein